MYYRNSFVAEKRSVRNTIGVSHSVQYLLNFNWGGGGGQHITTIVLSQNLTAKN
jgi:hypothetical protein